MRVKEGTINKMCKPALIFDPSLFRDSWVSQPSPEIAQKEQERKE
jgi:hypothetical protein